MILVADCQCHLCRAASPSGAGIRHIIKAKRSILEAVLARNGGHSARLADDNGIASGLTVVRKENGHLGLLDHTVYAL